MLPNFLVVGAAKSGTTSLYHYLKQHPEIYMSPVKEPYFFSFINKKPNFKGPFDKRTNEYEIIYRIEDYEKLFSNVKNEKAIGESSNSYLYFKYTAEIIKEYIPDCKIIISLRNPVERAYSHYRQHIMLGHENLSFEDALKEEEKRKKLNWRWHYQYTEQSMYFEQVYSYYKNFPEKNIKIIIFDDLKNNPIKTIKSIFEFLEIDSNFIIDTTIYNKTGVPKNKLLHKFITQEQNILKKISKTFTSKKIRAKINKVLIDKAYSYAEIPEMKKQTKLYLKKVFKNDIQKLSNLIQVDLSFWLEQ